MSDSFKPSFDSKNLYNWNLALKWLESPQLYIDWTLVAAIGAALQRRVWFSPLESAIWPNQYIVLVGPPAIGKTLAASAAKKIFSTFDIYSSTGRSKSPIIVAPDSITFEALTQFMDKNKAEPLIWPEGIGFLPKTPYLSSPLAILAEEELGSFINERATDLVMFLTHVYNSGNYKKVTKTQGVDTIYNLCVTMLGSTTPDWLRGNFAMKLIGQGFTSRIIFVYAEEKRQYTSKAIITPDQVYAREEVRKQIEKCFKVFGNIVETPEASEWMEVWYRKHSRIPINYDRRLQDYYGRKRVHLIKAAIAIHFIDSSDLVLTVNDYERALALLNLTEIEMHKALIGVARNPLYTLATSIEKYLKSKQEAVLFKRIICDFYSEGSPEEIKDAVEWLRETMKIESVMNERNQQCYCTKKIQEIIM